MNLDPEPPRRTQVNMRLGQTTLAQLHALAALYGSQTQAMVVAIDRLYQAEIGHYLGITAPDLG